MLMKKIRVFPLVLIMVMIFSLLTGCSKEEKGLYNLSQEMNGLDKYQITGEMSFSLDQVDPELFGLSSQELSLVQSILNNYNFTFDAKIDTVASKLIFTNYIQNKNTGEQKVLLTVLSDGNKVYLKMDDFFNYIKSFGNEETNREIDREFASVQYISIDRQEMKDMFTELYNSELLAEQLTKVYFDLGSFVKMNKEWQKNYKDLMEKVYDEYEMGIVKESNNKYTVSLSLQDTVNVFASFLKYSIDHIEELDVYLKQEIPNLGLDNDKINEVNMFLNSMVNNIKDNKELYKSQIDLGLSAVDSSISMWEGSQFEYSLEKTKDNAYVVDFSGKINYHDAANAEKSFKGSCIVKQTVKGIDSVTFTVPTENILTMTELRKIAESAINEPIKLNINLKNGSYTSGNQEGKLGIKVIDSTSYLPLKEIGNILGENINWDSAKKQPYVEKNGAKNYLNAKVIGGTSYIPSREFEKLGYKVLWDAKSNTVNIER